MAVFQGLYWVPLSWGNDHIMTLGRAGVWRILAGLPGIDGAVLASSPPHPPQMAQGPTVASILVSDCHFAA